jgi:membrane associated rhomboid family serine protease
MVLITISIVVFVVQAFFEGMYCPGMCPEGVDPFTYSFSLVPQNAINGGQFYQFVTYMFLHGGSIHILFNMFVLLIFGGVVEQALGIRRYITLYLVSGIGAAFLHVALTGISDVVMLGASGAVFGILAAYGFMFPSNRIIVFPIPVPLPSWIAIIGIAILEFILGVYSLESGIANFGHLGGIITGAALVYYWKGIKPRDVHEKRRYEFFWE